MGYILYLISVFLMQAYADEELISSLNEACERNEYSDCFALAKIYQRGGIPKQPETSASLVAKAIALKTKACQNGDVKACFALGEWFYDGYDLPKDISMAAKFFAQGCELGEWSSCTTLAKLYQKSMPKEGAQKAQRIYQKIIAINQEKCQKEDAVSCHQLGNLYRNGHAVEPSPTKSNEYFQRAQSIYERECERGSAKDCGHLGSLYLRGKGVKKDLSTAEHHLQQACALGDDELCFDLGMHYQYDHPLEDKSTAYYQQSFALTQRKCLDTKQPEKCRDLGYMLISGTGTELDIWKGEMWYRTACEQEDADACFELGSVYRLGIGGGKNPQKAQALFRKACAGGIQASCTP